MEVCDRTTEWVEVLDAFGRANCCVALVSADRRVILANSAYSRYLGFDDEREMRGLDIHAFTHPDDLALCVRAYDAVISGREAVSQVDKRYVGPKGVAWARATITLARSAMGPGPTAVVVCEDLTLRRETEEKLRTALALLQRAPLAATPTHDPEAPSLAGLSRRESEVVRLLLENHRVSSIATMLGVCKNTVRNHLTSAFRKIGVHSQAELVERFVHGPGPHSTAPRE
jgi:PAS domain S-box-containing protein